MSELTPEGLWDRLDEGLRAAVAESARTGRISEDLWSRLYNLDAPIRAWRHAEVEEDDLDYFLPAEYLQFIRDRAAADGI